MSEMICYCVDCDVEWFSEQETEEEHRRDANRERHVCSGERIGRCVQGTEITAYANFYAEGDRSYGGPEEGGWYAQWYDCITSVQVKVVLEPEWEDVGGPESGPRLVCNGFERAIAERFVHIVCELRKVYDETHVKIEYAPGRSFRSPPGGYE